ncbi:MAG: UDP-3-O-acyl-N-acetylglucosamine deacetylase [Thermodesulfobacteriota bacterium]
MQIFQRTLTRPVTCTGIGLHSGRKVNLNLRPADPDTGVMFKRSDLPGAPLIPADVNHVVDTRFSTTIGLDGVAISTVEHLLSALAGMGVDNAIVEVDAPELPIMDGSAGPFVFLIKSAGLTSQARPRQFYRVRRAMSISEDGKEVSVAPADKLSVDFTIDFSHPAIRTQRMGFDLEEKSYAHDISRARTFGFLADMRRLHQANLALGGSLDNAVVLDNYRVLNDDGLRFPDEFVRHKVLDFLGDLALVGRPMLGRFTAHKSGHDLNNKLFRKLLADPSAWQLVTPSQEAEAVPPAAQATPVMGQASVA